MMDVLINQNGDLHLAHDEEDLPRVKAIKVLRESGHLHATLDDGSERELGQLTAANLAILGRNQTCSIFPLRGFEVIDAYDAELGHA